MSLLSFFRDCLKQSHKPQKICMSYFILVRVNANVLL